jgi:YD repeat-containing protein
LQGATTLATVTTNSTGDYAITSIAPGTYTIAASAVGYGTKNQNLVTVGSGATTTVNLSLDAIVAGPVSYIYDALGRLISTVGPTDTVTYTYDAAGNLLSVSRESSSQLSIISVVPNTGTVGATVTIYGSGFSSVANQNTVQFGGVAAAITSNTTSQIVTTVPAVGVTGLIQIAVTTPGGTATAPFTVIAGSTQSTIQVTPANISIAPGGSVQLTAVINGLAGDQSIKWSVNGVDGGSSTIGTISTTGYYSSSNQASNTSVYAIRATSIANPSLFGQAQVAVLNPSYAEAVISPSISVQRSQLTATAMTVVSVRKNLTVPSGVAATSVSVRKNSSTVVAPTTAVSVSRAPQTIVFGSISAAVSVTTGPYIQSVSPASGSKGATFSVTITGVNLQGATGLSFITTGGIIDSSVTASGISVNADGTSLTATVTVNASAALGRRIIVVTTPANHSLAADVGSNIIEVIQ